MAVLYGVPLAASSVRSRSTALVKHVPFTAPFGCLPLDSNAAQGPDDEGQDVFYLGDDGQLIGVRPHERALGFRPCGFELNSKAEGAFRWTGAVRLTLHLSSDS